MAAIGIDVGGTFTDFVLARDGQLHSLKVLSTPEDLTRAVLTGLRRLLAERSGHSIVHGSTVATNALLERKGARTALITTDGFRDLMEIGRQARPELYDIRVEKPAPLVPAERCFTVRERLDYLGDVLTPLDDQSAKHALRSVADSGAESLAVCLLFSFANPAHERRLGELAAGLGIPVSLSSDILPEFREFERCSTTVANAYLVPVLREYLTGLEKSLAGSSLRIMQSSGASISPQAAAEQPVRTALSGPAGGAVGAAAVAAQAGWQDIIAFDMGGTSTDVSLSRGGPAVTTETVIDGFPIRVPVIDIHTIGAGGGSIAWVDDGGALRVGPRSAGADPGPACYGRGEEPTVTDANLLLGRLGEQPLLAGEMPLDEGRAQRAVASLAERLGLDEVACAEGIVEVANAAMLRAMRVISVQRGHDPRDFCLVAFGGAGPLHACELAAQLQAPRVLVPTAAGVLSAYGMLVADVARDYAQTVMLTRPAEPTESEASELERHLVRAFEALTQRGMPEMAAEGFDGNQVESQRSLDVRYRGQSFELTVPFCPDFAQEFHDIHGRVYGYSRPDRPMEIVTVRVRLVARPPKPELPPIPRSAGDARPTGRVRVRHGGEWHSAAQFRRADLAAGHRFSGPAVVTEEVATTFVPQGHACTVDDWGNLVLTRS
ncbi:MAG: hydantoinase/oxoprolinase family protein [Armatimonadota bacterium]